MTRIVGVSMVRNECDVVEVFVRHTLAFCDEMIVTDHRSTDGTLEILQALRDEGLPLRILRDERHGIHQADTVERSIRLAASEHAADWVVPVDADEFLVASGALTLRQCLDEANGEPLRAPWRSYVPLPEDDESERNPVLRIQHRRARELKTFHKVLVPRSLALRRDVAISNGNHRLLMRRWGRKPRKLEGADFAQFALAHFPVRSRAQVTRKALLTWVARRAAPEPRPALGYQVTTLFERVKAAGDLSREELRDIALDYLARERSELSHERSEPVPAGATVHDPVPLAEEARRLRYLDLARHEPLWSLVETAVDLAEEVSALATRQRSRPVARIRRLVAGWHARAAR